MIGFVAQRVISTSVQALMFGLYLASFMHCIRWQVLDDEGWKFRKKINWAMLTIAVVLFLFSTIDFSLTLHMGIAAAQGDIHYFEYPWVINAGLEESAILITDAVLIYRCWTVYARSWRVVCLPILFWISFFISAILSTFYYAVLISPRNMETAFDASILQYRFLILGHCSTIVTNVYATSAIMLRILKVAKGVSTSNSSKRLQNVSRILAESGILFTVTSILCLVGRITTLFPEIGSILNFAATGITFNLILIRIGQDRSNTYDESCTDLRCTNGEGVLSTLQFQYRITTIDEDITDFQRK